MARQLLLAAVFVIFFGLGFGFCKLLQDQLGFQHTSGSPLVFLIWLVSGVLSIQAVRVENRLLWSRFYPERLRGASRYDFAPLSYGMIVGAVSALVFFAR